MLYYPQVMKMNSESILTNRVPRRYLYTAPVRTQPAGRAKEKARDPYDGLRAWSAITHGAGAGLAAFGTLLLLIRVMLLSAGVWHIVSFGIYGLSMVVLYTASTLYHSVNTSVRGRIALRKYDHAAIYFLIAGTYTPVCLIALRDCGYLGWTMFGVSWGLALAGLVLTLVWISAPRWLTSAIYLVMGWLSVFVLVPLAELLPPAGLFLLLGGGVLYTIGGVLYAAKWPGRNNPRFGCHEIFHLFILLGSIFHFLLMYCVVAPM